MKNTFKTKLQFKSFYFSFRTIGLFLLLPFLMDACNGNSLKKPASEENGLALKESGKETKTSDSSDPEVMPSSASLAGATTPIDKASTGLNNKTENKISGKSVYESELKSARAQPVRANNVSSEMIIGINLGYLDIIFKPEGKSVSIHPGAAKALNQIKKDGFTHLRMMEPFAKGFMPDFPNLPVQAIKRLIDQGFHVLICIGGSPFINGSDNKEKWVYRFFPGDDRKGHDDDGGIVEHKRRMKLFMDALKAEGLLKDVQFELFNEPNSDKFFWGSFEQFEELLSINKEILLQPQYGIQEQDVLCCAFTSNLAKGREEIKPEQVPYLNFAKSFRENSKVNKMSFSFHWYPANGIAPNAYQANSTKIKFPNPLLNGSWITEMNVSGHMNKKQLFGDGKNAGYRARNSFQEKASDIIDFAKRNHVAGIYFFNLKNKSDEPNEEGKIGLGLFNESGCPRKEYKDLLKILDKPIHFDACPDPKPTDL